MTTHQGTCYQKTLDQAAMQVGLQISVIVPMLNEAASIAQTLAALQDWRMLGHELMVVDGGSTDESCQQALPWADQVISAPRGRALQMNAGAQAAKGSWLLFLHADTRLPADALARLYEAHRAGKIWGRFDVRLSGDGWLFRLIASLINLRSRLTGIATGDQAMFVRRDWFERLAGFAAIPLMEDVELSARLCRADWPDCVRSKVTTDSRRWEKQGVWRTIFLMWRLRWHYWRGVEPAVLARQYLKK